ncbi:MAG: dihydrodipicolinate synthase family protein [Acetobacter sp.]|nr:dihydrodipicolinate synthase family protein [Bacteroides sp.]MCM1342104.1 dihydrodipicolinate synthase family protein [Acetobacter sp.]MCM1434318.1 dihydrodipicolinate synthase family protein [Clostridiales bacterium]
MTDLSKFRGVFCALNAIYDKNNSIDEEKIKELVKIYKSLGVKGVYACGSTGEGFLLSTDERKQVAKAVKEAAGEDFTVIIHVGCASTKESIELAKHAEAIGADAISAVPSVYYRLPAESVKMHWNSIVSATDVPFIIYNIPQLTGFDLTPDMLSEFAENKKIIGVKNSAEPVYLMERYRKAAGDDFIIFNGSDEQFVGGRLMGADAGIGGTYGCMPELFVALDNLVNENKIEEAKVLQYKINECIFDLLACKSLYGAAKQVMSIRFGIECGNPRSPFLPVSREDALPIAEKINKFVSEL